MLVSTPFTQEDSKVSTLNDVTNGFRRMEPLRVWLDADEDFTPGLNARVKELKATVLSEFRELGTRGVYGDEQLGPRAETLWQDLKKWVNDQFVCTIIP